MSDEVEGDYSAVAVAQLDALMSRPAVYNAVLDVCELIFTDPDAARAESSAAITEGGGLVFAYPVPGTYPLRVWWTSAGPRIEAVFPYERN